MSSWNIEHIPVGQYRKYTKNFTTPDGRQPYINGYPFGDNLSIHILYACGSELPKQYSYRVKPAQNRKLCKKCCTEYFPGYETTKKEWNIYLRSRSNNEQQR